MYPLTSYRMLEGSSVTRMQTTKQLSNEHLQLQTEDCERGFAIDDFDIEDIDEEYNDNSVHHQYLVSVQDSFQAC